MQSVQWETKVEALYIFLTFEGRGEGERDDPCDAGCSVEASGGFCESTTSRPSVYFTSA